MNSGGDGPAPSRVVIEKLADADGVEPVELEPPLGTVIDTDALDRLFATRSATAGRVTFRYCDYDVTVTSEGNVMVSSVPPHPVSQR